MRKTAKDLETIKCPVCGKNLCRKDLEDDPEFTYSDYYCDVCEINITIHAWPEEENN